MYTLYQITASKATGLKDPLSVCKPCVWASSSVSSTYNKKNKNASSISGCHVHLGDFFALAADACVRGIFFLFSKKNEDKIVVMNEGVDELNRR